jgi:hypothetical protein
MSKKLISAGVALLTGVLAVGPALAQAAQGEAACVRPNRIFSTQALDNRTILVTDKQKNQYTIHMSSVCAGMDKSASALGFRYFTELSCLQRGDRISVPIGGGGTGPRVTCFIGSVTAGAPADAPG